jgi:hypothetical protein
MPATAEELANQEWVDQRYGLGRLGNAWLDQKPSVADFDLELEQERYKRQWRYSELGRWLNQSFKMFIVHNLRLLEPSSAKPKDASVTERRKSVAIKLTNDRGVDWGFTVMGHTLDAAAVAAKYGYITQGIQTYRATIQNALNADATFVEVLDKLASMPPAVNEL